MASTTATEKKELNPYTHDEHGLKYDPSVLPKDRYIGDNGVQATDSIPYWLKATIGGIMTVNFIIFWLAAVALCGMAWRFVLCRFLRPIYNYFDQHPVLRNFAVKYVYTNPRHADYFFQSIIALTAWIPPFIYMFYAQITQGYLTWGQIYMYTFAWVGIRGGVLGSVYSLTHKEGHNSHLYQPFIRKYIGNFFEVYISPFFGSVPYNFSTTHNYLHHSLQARSADSFYQYDMDRTSLPEFFVLLFRIASHCAGVTAYNQMRIHGLKSQCKLLAKGLMQYYFIYPAIMLGMTQSWSFLFWMYFQPFVGMTFFLTFMNVAFHAFVEYDENGTPVESVFSTDMLDNVEGLDEVDDYWGENSHLSHHVAGHVYWRDLDESRKKMYDEFKMYHGSIFRGLSIPEVAGMMLFDQWDTLATHFVQFNDEPAPNKPSEEWLLKHGAEDLSQDVKQSVWVGTGKLTLKEVACMLKTRAARREPKWIRADLLFVDSAKTSWEAI